MTPPSPAAYLAALPPEIQARLERLVRASANTTEDEKVLHLTALNVAADALFFHPDAATPLEYLACCAELIAEVHRSATTKGA